MYAAQYTFLNTVNVAKGLNNEGHFRILKNFNDY